MAEFIPLGIQGAWLFRSDIHADERGFFREWFRVDALKEQLGFKFDVAQANISKSNKSVARGIHFSTASHGQAKWVTCAQGSIWDVVVDIRPNSPTFKKWISLQLEASDGQSIFIGDGLGHAFLALEDESVLSYLTTATYDPKTEFTVNIRDPELKISWPTFEINLSSRDINAPTLEQFLNSQK